MRYYLIAGEASGDLHGANLIKGLKKSDPNAEFRFWGGDRMAEAGGSDNLARHYKTASFFGFLGVARNLRTIFRQLDECKRDIKKFVPDAVIHIDYPGFNFRIAKFAHKAGFNTFYYISPKVWAWKESRVKLIRKYIDKLFIIFPFEIPYFQKKGIDAVFEGNPLVDVIEDEKKKMPSRAEFLRETGIADDKPIVALLAGSRRSEIKYNFPFMVTLAEKFPEYRFVVGGVKWLDKQIYDNIIRDNDVTYICDRTYQLLNFAEAAVVTSGTATLETALFNVPEFVCYTGDRPSMYIARMFIKTRFISLVNLIMDREVVRELIQWDMTIPNARQELRDILPGGEKHDKLMQDYSELRALVGGPGASERFAAKMVDLLKNGEEE